MRTHVWLFALAAGVLADKIQRFTELAPTSWSLPAERLSSVAEEDGPVLPQCVPGEQGCDKNPMKNGYAVIWRYHADDQGRPCLGKPIARRKTNLKGVQVRKMQCKTWAEAPIGDSSMNYVLPKNKIMNHCDMTFYDAKHCQGKAVLRIDGYSSSNMFNGQRYCHKIPFAKSVYLGPCS